MAYPTWQPGTLYQPGDIVVPATMPAPTASTVVNGSFDLGSGGWDYSGGAAYFNGYGWDGNASLRMAGNVSDGAAFNQTKLVVPVGKEIIASCMIQQGASNRDATRGWVEVQWFLADDSPLGTPEAGNVVNNGSGGTWHKSTVTAKCPEGAAYGRAGIVLWSNTNHNNPVWGDALKVEGVFSGLPADLAYKAVQPESGFSGAGEPAWPPILGQEVVDNEVTWEAISGTRVEWTAEPLYVSGDTEPDWPEEEGAYIKDGTATLRAVSRRVEDPNCPNTKIVAIAASKVFCGDDDIVRYSATVNPLDWSTADDAGYLPTGLQNYGSNPVAAMGLYRGNMIPFNAEAFQLWQVDEGPANMALLDALPMGSTQHHAIAPVSNDLFFLASQGVRTVGIAASSTNFQAGDVGMPIDPLVQEAMRQAAVSGSNPLAAYVPAMGQYWLMFPRYGNSMLIGPTISGSAPDCAQGEAWPGYTYAVNQGTAPIQSVRIVDGMLPEGLEWDEASRSIIGSAPTGWGIYGWTLQVIDANGRSATLSDSMEVEPTYAACGMPVAYGGGQSFPSELEIYLGVETGTVELQFATADNPDKFEVWLGGVKVLDTGYYGATSYQAQLNSALAAKGLPPETITQRTPGGFEPEEQMALGKYDTASFVKTTADSVAIVKTYAPIAGTAWVFKLGCPQG